MNTKANLPMDKKLATMVLAAMQIREESYDHAASAEASAKADAEKAAEPHNLYAGFVDFAKFYRKTMREACEEAAKNAGEPNMGEVIYYLCAYVWNDIEDWANRVL